MNQRKLKNTLILCVTGVFFFYSYATSAPDYTAQAQAWLKKYIISSSGQLMLTQHDAQQLANLLYYSYERSYATIKVQQQALLLMQTLWKSWENITHTRMNPAKKILNPLLTQQDVAALTTYLQAEAAYHVALQAYATISEFVVKGSAVESATLKDGIKELRTDARKVVAQALLDVKKHVAQLATYAQTKSITFDKDHNARLNSEELCRTASLKEFFTTYIPKLAVSSFIETEHSTNTISNESWRLLFGMQEVSSYVWHTLEAQRASFYKEYYQVLYTALKKNTMHKAIFSSIVESNKTLPAINLQEFKFYSN